MNKGQLKKKRDALVLHHNNLIQQAEQMEQGARVAREQATAARGQVALLEELMNAEENEDLEDVFDIDPNVLEGSE